MNDFLCDDLLQWILSPQESEIEELLSQAFGTSQSESHVDTVTPTFCANSAASSSSLCGSTCHKCHFAEPKSDEEIAEARAKGIPLKTQQDMKYCMRQWEDWVQQ